MNYVCPVCHLVHGRGKQCSDEEAHEALLVRLGIAETLCEAASALAESDCPMNRLAYKDALAVYRSGKGRIFK